MRKKFVDDGDLGLRRFRSGADFLLQTIVPLLQRGEIGQDEFGVDHLDVANRVDRAADVMDIRVLEATDDLHDRVDLANVAEELVAESFAGARAFHEARDVHKLDRGRDDLLRVRKFRERFEARVGHGDDAEIRIDRAEGVVRGLRFARARDGVEKRGLADIRQPDNSSAQHRRGR